MSWLDNITDSMDVNLSKFSGIMKDTEVQGGQVTKLLISSSLSLLTHSFQCTKRKNPLKDVFSPFENGGSLSAMMLGLLYP